MATQRFVRRAVLVVAVIGGSWVLSDGSFVQPQRSTWQPRPFSGQSEAHQRWHRRGVSCRARTDPEEDLWTVLGVEPGSSLTEVKRVYRKRAKTEHPDVNKDPGALKRWQ
ncbi:unnamed protein product, partial [Polarella glacialis]